jgi:hypothetical protein
LVLLVTHNRTFFTIYRLATPPRTPGAPARPADVPKCHITPGIFSGEPRIHVWNVVFDLRTDASQAGLGVASLQRVAGLIAGVFVQDFLAFVRHQQLEQLWCRHGDLGLKPGKDQLAPA